MDLTRLGDQVRMIKHIHPALDIVDDIVCVTVQASVDHRLQPVVLTSRGEVFSAEEWATACAARGLEPHPAVPCLAQSTPRWHSSGIQEVCAALGGGNAQDDSAPSWKETYAGIYSALDGHLQVCDPRYLMILTLYAMMTYVHPLFDFLPILHLRGPAESGKSRAGATIAALAFNGLMIGSPTPSTVFRTAHEGRYTQIIAEADHLEQLSSGDAFVRQLQSACSRAEASVNVSEGSSRGGYTPQRYLTFSPRVLLSTKALGSQPLRSRCIRLDLVKNSPVDNTRLRRSITDDTVWAPQRDRLYRLLLVRWTDVRPSSARVKHLWSGPGAPTGRTFDKWLPLAAIAGLVGEDVVTALHGFVEEDMVDQQEDALDRIEAHLIQFALWLVRDGANHEYSRRELYHHFMVTDQTQASGGGVPQWAQACGVTVTCDQLKEWVRGEGALVRELRRLHLVGPSIHRAQGNRFLLDQERIHDAATATLGREGEKCTGYVAA